MIQKHSPLLLLGKCPITIALTALALVASAVPAIGQLLALDFARLGEGQWWRLWTGHVTHFDAEHLLWDLTMFVALGSACEFLFRKRFPVVLAIMAAVISASICLFCDHIATYRGLSGIDTGLFVWLAGYQIGQAIRQRDRLLVIAWSVPCLGLIAKLLYEAFTHQTLFVHSKIFLPLVEAHLAGVLIGGIAALWSNAKPED